MLTEEHRLVPIDRRHALRAALVVGLSAIAGSLVPLAPFAVLPVRRGAMFAVLLAALVLFALGVYKAHVTVGRPLRSGIELAAIGTVSALVGYGVGAMFHVTAAP
jgi:predicted membrane protein (TIGR00267 family)